MSNPSFFPAVDPQVVNSMQGVLERLQKDIPLAAFQENILQIQFDDSISLTNKVLFYSIVNTRIQQQFIGLPIAELQADSVTGISEIEENISVVIGLKLALLENVLQLYLQANEENVDTVDMFLRELIPEIIELGVLQARVSIVVTKLFTQIQNSISNISKLTPKFASQLVQFGAIFVQEFLGLATSKPDAFRFENTSKLINVIMAKADAFEQVYIYQELVKFLEETAKPLTMLLLPHDLTQSLGDLMEKATISEDVEKMLLCFATSEDPYSEPAALLMNELYEYISSLANMLEPIRPDDTDENSTAGTIGW